MYLVRQIHPEILSYHWGVAGLPDLIKSIPVELLQCVKIKLQAQGFVEQLNGYNYILIFWLSILCADPGQNLEGLCDSVSLLPTRRAKFMT